MSVKNYLANIMNMQLILYYYRHTTENNGDAFYLLSYLSARTAKNTQMKSLSDEIL